MSGSGDIAYTCRLPRETLSLRLCSKKRIKNTLPPGALCDVTVAGTPSLSSRVQVKYLFTVISEEVTVYAELLPGSHPCASRLRIRFSAEDANSVGEINIAYIRRHPQEMLVMPYVEISASNRKMHLTGTTSSSTP